MSDYTSFPPLRSLFYKLLSSFSSHLQLVRPLSVHMHSLLSHPLLDLNVLPFHTHSFLPWFIPNPLICFSALSNFSKSDTPTYILQTLFLEHITTHNNCTPVYTDFSKSQYGSGFTILFPFALRKLLSYPSSTFVIFTLKILSFLCSVIFTL